MAYAKRRIRMQVRATPDAGDGTFEAVVSTYELEYEVGYGWTEQILAGCFADSISAHPTIPIFYNHNWDGAPIGSGKPTENGSKLTVAGRLYLEIGDPLVARVYQAMQDEALEEWSIGFWPEQINWDSDNPRCDMIAKGDLAESSVCVRGANPDTGTLELNARRMAWIEGNEEARQLEVSRLRQRFHVPGFEARAAIAVHHTGTSTSAWDGPAQQANLSNDDGAAVYKKAFAWVDPAKDADTKAAYKFIHHFVSSAGDVGDASTVGCTAGIAVLNGGRGGTTIPDGDVQGVYNHLAAHLKDADITPPELKSDGAGDPALRADGHSHQHAHDDGTTHTHEHTHSGGNYDHGDNSTDPDLEVPHAHGHDDIGDTGGAGTEEDPGPDASTKTRDRLYRALGDPNWAPVLADLKGKP
jgi:HK97 family phage prohead protease